MPGSVVVAGATGAIGREFIIQAVSDDFFTRVVALSRRDIAEDKWAETWPGVDLEKARAKLKVYGVDWEGLCAPEEAAMRASKNAAKAFSGNAYAVNLMGSTRKDAGSAEAFHRYDFDYYEAFVKAVASFNPLPAAVHHFSQISSTGASASSWFLYMKTKGLADEMLMRRGGEHFAKISFWRPGLLGRKEKARTVEKIGAFFSSPMPVERVAAAMIEDIKTNKGRTAGEVATCADQPTRADAQTVRAFYNADIKALTPGFGGEKVGGGGCCSADTSAGAEKRSDL